MYCTQCGTKLPDGTTVCPNCKANLAPKAAPVPPTAKPTQPVQPAPQAGPAHQAAPQPQPAAPKAAPQPPIPPTAPKAAPQNAAPQAAPGMVPPQPPVPKEKKPLLKSKLFWGLLGSGVLLLLLIIIGVVIWLQPEKIEVDQYVTVEYEGYDGYARAHVELDELALYEAMMEATGQSVSDYADIDSLWDLGGAVYDGVSLYTCIDTIELTPSKTENLSNGDTIDVAITYDNEVARKMDIEFVGDSVSVTVEGLKPVQEVDPFEDLKVTFTGIAPSGQVEFEYTGSNENISSYNFEADRYDGLRNGDMVTITYNVSDEDTLYYGYVLSTKEKQYEVSGLQEYADSYADLTADFLATLKSESEDTIYSYIANNYDSSCTMTNLEYCGYIMNCIKDASGYVDSYNDLYLIYRGDVSHSKGEFNTTKVYYPVQFENILIDGDQLSYEEKDGIEGSASIGDTWYYTDGYVNPLICYNEIVAANQEDYTAECGDGFEVYAEYTLISSLEDIGADYKATLEADAKDRIESYVADSYGDTSKMADLKVAGEYLLLAKNQGSDFANNNRYYIVYSATVSSTENRFKETTVYFPVEYSGLVALPDGTFMLTSVGGIKGSSNLPDSYYSTKGYVDGTKMFSDLVTANREKYTYIVSEGLQSFGK